MSKLNKVVRFFGKLANGQFAYVDFWLYKAGANDKPAYKMSFVIGDTPKTCRYWLRGKKSASDNAITGKDMEGMIWIKQVMLEFIEDFLPKGACLIVEGDDKKRYSAYKRYLLRKFPGFEEWLWDNDPNRPHLIYWK